MITIEICMGSSCFARGNREVLEVLEKFIEENSADGEISLSGSLCMNRCSCGPHLTVNGDRLDFADPESALESVGRLLGEARE